MISKLLEPALNIFRVLLAAIVSTQSIMPLMANAQLSAVGLFACSFISLLAEMVLSGAKKFSVPPVLFPSLMDIAVAL